MNSDRNRKAIRILMVVLFSAISTLMGSSQARYIGRDFIEFCSKVPWEDIFLHTDRDEYISGENIWFDVYAFDRQHLIPSTLSRIAYVELLDYNSRPVMGTRILLSNGTGPGQISLPDTLSSGIYTLKAYTSWMKNFLPDGCFTKEIGIYNAVSQNNTMRVPLSENESSASDPGKESGFQLITVNSNPEVIEIMMVSSGEYRKSNGPSCNLFIHTRGNINISESITLSGDTTRKVISRSMLLPGINHITIFDVHGMFLTERFIYTAASEVKSVEISADTVFAKRSKIMLSIGPTGTTDFRNLSLSVAPEELENSPGLDEFLIFGTEFDGGLLKKFKKLRNSKNPSGSIDSMLLNVRSRWINWNVIAGSDSVILKYQPETSEHFLSGRLVNGNADSYVIMSVPGKQATFRYAKTDKSGNFSFSIPVDEEMKEIIIQPDEMKGIVNIGSPFLEDYPSLDNNSEKIPDFVTNISVNFQVQKIYETLTAEKVPPGLSSTAPKRFYGKPDIELVLADYIKLPVMEEIFFELLPGTYLKKRKSEYEIYVTDPVTNLPYDFPTTLFVDGVRINDAGAIAAIDPENVEKIEVVRERYMVGDYLFHGIVNIVTKAGDFTQVTIPEYAVRTYYRVIDPSKKFTAPDYDESKNLEHIPDFRNTLWWDPSVNGKVPVKFWSSDVPGKYRIAVNGIAGDGSPVSTEKIITIK